MSDAPKPQKQPWLDSLLTTISKERDPRVSESAPQWQEIVDCVRANTITREEATQKLNVLRDEVLAENTTSKYRTQELLRGTIQFVLKEFKE